LSSLARPLSGVKDFCGAICYSEVMQLTLILLAILSVLEIVLWTPLAKSSRNQLAWLTLIGLLILLPSLIIQQFTALRIILALLNAYRAINLLRLVRGRGQINYRYFMARQTSGWLIGAQVVIGVVEAALQHTKIDLAAWLYGLMAAQLVGALLILLATERQARKSKITVSVAIADRDLPSVTVAIPARNETTDLEACLQSLLASTYPKLEILVLDDCSQNKRTPEIIQAFAHGGVRFVAGKVPPEKWLAKNYAYEQLVEASTGDLLLFCGVDTQFEADTLKVLVDTLLAKKKTMLCVVPRNQLRETFQLLVQGARYAWEFSLPRRQLNRPPVLSTCWLITRKSLLKAGGFAAVAHSVSPESYFARQAIAKDGYSFARSDSRVGLFTTKSFDEQRATAVRLRYPQLHRRIEMVAVTGLAELFVVVIPFTAFLGSIVVHSWPFCLLSGASSLLLTLAYCRVIQLAYQKFIVRSVLLLPFAALYDIALLHYSMWQYEFNQVIWKDRNVCIPVMQTFAHLPGSR